ncbi:MAG: hypothetical protein JWM72_372 [Actinomycetia bacterium]|nr:hypothetical protein [Actinomycetes bacterium]MDQ1459945.1 hypothetical protein [Actinomycetota bacterium]
MSGTDLAERARWLLVTHEGRVALAVVYSIASLASIVTYTIVRSPLYGLGQLVVTGFGLFWARWCLRHI